MWCSCADVEPGRLATTCAVVSACVAIAEITEIDAGDRKIVIDRHGELIFVACGFRESAAALRRFTRAAHDAVLASLTDKIHAALERRPNADIGALLGSAKLVLAGLARTEDRSRMLGPLGLATESVPDLLLEPGVRRSIQGALKDALASLKGVPVVGAVLFSAPRETAFPHGMAYEGETYAPYGGPVGSAKEICLRSLKRTHTMYLSNYGQRPDFEEPCAAPPPCPPQGLSARGSPLSHGRAGAAQLEAKDDGQGASRIPHGERSAAALGSWWLQGGRHKRSPCSRGAIAGDANRQER